MVYFCIVLHEEDISTSGHPNPLDFNASNQFINHEELPSKGYCRLVKAQRYGRWFMLKGLKPDFAADPLYVAMLEKEFWTAVGLDNLFIARTYSLEDDPVAGRCIVMEYVDGVTLSRFLERKPSKADRRRVASQLLEAMAYYHAKQVVHRDLKPSNIMITANGDNVKLIDFGLADANDYAILKEPAFSRGFAAPEQMQPGAPVDCRTDIYAFGVLLRLLFPFRYRSVALRCTRKKPSRRWPSAAAVSTAMQRYDTLLKLVPAGVLLLAAGIAAAVAASGTGSDLSPDNVESPTVETYAPESQQPSGIQPVPAIQEAPKAPTSPAAISHHADMPASHDQQAAHSSHQAETPTALSPLEAAKYQLRSYADNLFSVWQSRIDDGTYNTSTEAEIAREYMFALIHEKKLLLLRAMGASQMNDYQYYYSQQELAAPPLRDKADHYLEGKNLPRQSSQSDKPQIKELTDSLGATRRRIDILEAIVEGSR